MKLKYWITSGFQTLLYVVLATSVYGLMMTLQMSNMDWMDLLMLLPIYLLLFGAMWSINWTAERNKQLTLLEFGGAKF